MLQAGLFPHRPTVENENFRRPGLAIACFVEASSLVTVQVTQTSFADDAAEAAARINRQLIHQTPFPLIQPLACDVFQPAGLSQPDSASRTQPARLSQPETASLFYSEALELMLASKAASASRNNCRVVLRCDLVMARSKYCPAATSR
jgi:hypothetical protein